MLKKARFLFCTFSISVLSMGLASSVDGAKVRLEAWTLWSSGQSYEDFKTAATMYMKKNPNVIIDIKGISSAGERIKVSTAAGLSPDVLFINGGVLENAARYSYFVKPLNAYIKRDGLTGKYLKAAIDLFAWEGVTYAVPWSVDPNFAMIYNADAFAEVGLPGRAPETPDEVTLFNSKLMKKGANGKITRMGTVPWRMYGEHTALINWGFAWGTGQLSDGKKYTLTNPNLLKAIDYWLDFGDKNGGAATVDAFGNKSYADLKSVAMQPMVLPDLEFALKQNKTMKIGIGEMPSTKEGVTPTWLGGQWLGIGIHSKKANEAWNFIKYATTDMEVAKATRLGRFSGFKEAYEKRIYTEGVSSVLGERMAPLMSFYSTLPLKAQQILQAPLWDTPAMCQTLRRIVVERKAEKVAALTDLQNKLNKRIDEMLKRTVKIPTRK